MKRLHEPGKSTRAVSGYSASPTRVLERARHWVLDLFNDHGDSRLLWHNFSRTNQLVQFCSRLTATEELEETDRLVLYLGAWFSFSGWLFDPADPLPASRQLATQFLQAELVPDNLRLRIHHLIGIASLRERPGDLVGRIVWDAAVALHYGTDYDDSASLRRKEVSLIQAADPDPELWRQLEAQTLQGLQCYTLAGKAEHEPAIATILESLVRKTEKEKKRRSDDSLRTGSNGPAIRSYFRTNSRNHIQLSAIADRKAQMLISVNAIIISVLISILSYSNLAETRTPLLIPITLFLVFGLTSLILAVLSARPAVTAKPLALMSDEDRRRHLVYFGHFTQLDPDRYEADMQVLFRNEAELYSAMNRDLYFLGRVLERKFRMLHLAFNLFLYGFIGAVVSFLVIQFLWI